MTTSVNKKMINTTVIYHENCTDGFMSAYLYWLACMLGIITEDVEYIACQYNKPVPVMNGQHVVVLDFSFTSEQLMDEKFRGKRVEIYDHHESSAIGHGGYGKKSGMTGIDNSVDLTTTFVKERSGAGITLDLIVLNANEDIQKAFHNLPTNEHLKYAKVHRIEHITKCVEDRDLWKFELDDTRKVYEHLNYIPRTFDAWDNFIRKISTDEFHNCLHDAGTRVEMRTQIAMEYAAKAHIAPYKTDKQIAIVNCPSNFASEVGSILAKQYAFAVMFVFSPSAETLIVSLRSRVNGGEDVSLIAGKFGGGGHVNAAGFSFNYNEDPYASIHLMSGRIFVGL